MRAARAALGSVGASFEVVTFVELDLVAEGASSVGVSVSAMVAGVVSASVVSAMLWCAMVMLIDVRAV
jgi:hypothetical protein